MRGTRVICLIVVLSTAASASALGCATKTTTVTTTATSECLDESGEVVTGESDCAVIVRETTVTKEVESSRHGPVGAAFGLVGELITLPFRIVGAVLGAIF